MARAIDADAVKRRAWDIAEAWKDQGRDYEALLLESVVEQIVDTQPTLTPPNEALTLEELREMDGEPVWVQTPGIPKYGCWVIVAGVDKEYGQRTLYCPGGYTCRNYGRDWIAYRRPPEGEADA